MRHFSQKYFMKIEIMLFIVALIYLVIYLFVYLNYLFIYLFIYLFFNVDDIFIKYKLKYSCTTSM